MRKRNGESYRKDRYESRVEISKTDEFSKVEKTYLNLAKSDFALALSNKNTIKQNASSITVSISNAIEKCLSHLLIIKGIPFKHTHSSCRLFQLVVKEYEDFPCEINNVVCVLSDLWYMTNRYPQNRQNGYESFVLILSMMTATEELIKYCEEQDKIIDYDKSEYERVLKIKI